MKVLIDGIFYSLEERGGVRRYFDEFLPLLTRLDRNLEIEFFLHRGFKGKLNFNSEIKISHIRELPVPLPKTLFQPLIDSINKLILRRYWRRIKGDVFHSTYYTRHPDKNIPQVVTVYDMIYEIFPRCFPGRQNNIFKKNKKKAIESADAIICISENTKKDILKYCRVDEYKISVVYPGKSPIFQRITDKKLKKRFLNKYRLKKPFLLYVGQRRHYKNFLLLAKAYSFWEKNADFDLVAVGGGEFTKREKEQLKELGIRNKIYNFPHVTDEDLALFYNGAYVFIFPSLYEGFGIPLLEAMACGTLVLASNRASFPEVGKDCILYFDPEDLRDIIRALDKALLKKQRLKLINKALKRVKDFSWEKTAKQTLVVYKKFS